MPLKGARSPHNGFLWGLPGATSGLVDLNFQHEGLLGVGGLVKGMGNSNT